AAAPVAIVRKEPAVGVGRALAARRRGAGRRRVVRSRRHRGRGRRRGRRRRGGRDSRAARGGGRRGGGAGRGGGRPGGGGGGGGAGGGAFGGALGGTSRMTQASRATTVNATAREADRSLCMTPHSIRPSAPARADWRGVIDRQHGREGQRARRRTGGPAAAVF